MYYDEPTHETCEEIARANYFCAEDTNHDEYDPFVEYGHNAVLTAKEHGFGRVETLIAYFDLCTEEQLSHSNRLDLIARLRSQGIISRPEHRRAIFLTLA